MLLKKTILLAMLGAVTACTSHSISTTAQGHRKILYVAADQVSCVGVAPMTCMQVRERPDQPWTLDYSGIEGFEARPGTEYKLQIIETTIANPPADGSSVKRTLEKILEQRVVKK